MQCDQQSNTAPLSPGAQARGRPTKDWFAAKMGAQRPPRSRAGAERLHDKAAQGRGVLAQKAFTLTEILIAILIFTIVSAAMITVFNSATTLFQSGQAARAANDEAMTILTRIDLDCSAAVGPDGGGKFYSWLDDNGNCVVGWTVRRSNPGAYQDYLGFVLYGVNDSDQLLRREVEINTNGFPQVWVENGSTGTIELQAGGFSLNNPLGIFNSNSNQLTPQAMLLSEKCYHFGVWLVGTDHPGDFHSEVPSNNPSASNALARTTYWHFVSDTLGGSIEDKVEPSALTGPDGLSYYTSLEEWTDGTWPSYPSTARFTLVLGGSGSNSDEGKLANISGDHVSVRGFRALAVSEGGMVRVGSGNNAEWIGVHDQDSQGLLINDAWEQGPLGNDNDGRAILRSIKRDHGTGARVVAGRLFTLVKRLRY